MKKEISLKVEKPYPLLIISLKNYMLGGIYG